MSMRSKFTAPGLSIHYYDVEWEPAALAWADFRGAVLGPTDPATAPADSVRGLVYARWEALGDDLQGIILATVWWMELFDNHWGGYDATRRRWRPLLEFNHMDDYVEALLSGDYSLLCESGLFARDRAELAAGEYLPATSTLEGTVILKKNPEWKGEGEI